MKPVTVFAPATVANVAVGFDLLGFPIEGVGDEITLARSEKRGVEIVEISTLPSISEAAEKEALKTLPTDPMKNSATKGLFKFCEDQKLDFGFKVTIKKGISLGSGMGGSASSAVGAIVAANSFLDKPLPADKLFSYALIGEEVASGSAHGDNISPCLYGGLTLTRSIDPVEVIRIPVPSSIRCVVVHPALRVDTRDARKILKSEISLHAHVEQSSLLAGFLCGCFNKDLSLIGRCLSDIIIEPQRARLIPSFHKIKTAALNHGALGASLSGSGPSLFAWVETEEKGKQVLGAMVLAFQAAGIHAKGWVSPIRAEGAQRI